MIRLETLLKKLEKYKRHKKFTVERAKQVVPTGVTVFKLVSYGTELDFNSAVAVLKVTKPGLVPYGSITYSAGKYQNKFRVRAAKVLEIISLKTGRNIKNAWTRPMNCGEKFNYKVGSTVIPDGFTKDVNEDCGQGIHCFAEAERAYNLA